MARWVTSMPIQRRFQFLRGMDGGAAAAKGIENKIAFVGRGGDDAFEEDKGFLGRVA
jgi:hypothetical protein